jgi:hypothetical protein
LACAAASQSRLAGRDGLCETATDPLDIFKAIQQKHALPQGLQQDMHIAEQNRGLHEFRTAVFRRLGASSNLLNAKRAVNYAARLLRMIEFPPGLKLTRDGLASYLQDQAYMADGVESLKSKVGERMGWEPKDVQRKLNDYIKELIT